MDLGRLARQRKWDSYFMDIALTTAKMSKDPSTQVGAVIVNVHGTVVSTGFNGFPMGIADTHERLHDREQKLDLIVHGEMNAILAAARVGTALQGSTMYVTATDGTGEKWGGPPCVRCTVECMQAGITSFVSRPFKDMPTHMSRWYASTQKALELIHEAGLEYREIAKS